MYYFRTEKPTVTIRTDGACRNNGSPNAAGGYGAILEAEIGTKDDKTKKINYKPISCKISGGMIGTTNNRMELTAVLMAIRKLHYACSITIVTDSTYVRDAINAIADGNLHKREKNADLLEMLKDAMEIHSCVAKHISRKENAECDKLAKDAARRIQVLSETGIKEMEF